MRELPTPKFELGEMVWWAEDIERHDRDISIVREARIERIEIWISSFFTAVAYRLADRQHPIDEGVLFGNEGDAHVEANRRNKEFREGR